MNTPYRTLAAALAVLAFVACTETQNAAAPITPIGNGRSFGIWNPGPNETCTKADHDRFSTIGPDHKVYPTWHPPVDPVTGCTFGHEHGRDPRGSRLYSTVGDIPLGYANDQLDVWDPTGPRHEDHVGHKIEWENDIEMDFESDAANSLFNVRCDVLTKLHQGTHSRDAFTNNLHELVYHIRCTDGTEMHITVMAAIGTPGQFERSCDRATVVVGTATPANSPSGGGVRIIPDRFCVEQHMLVPPGQRSNLGSALHENWEVSIGIRTTSGRTVAFFNPYYQVFLPSRFHDPAAPNVTGRPIDVCYEVTATGERASSGTCDRSTDTGAVTVLYDDPRSEFNGVRRQVDINENSIENERGPASWYSDPFEIGRAHV